MRGCSCRGASGFAHVSCLARQAEVAVERRRRHGGPGLCKAVAYVQPVRAKVPRRRAVRAQGWACWKTYVGRPETDWCRQAAMTQLGNGFIQQNTTPR